MRNYFQLADKGNDKKVNENELNKFLKSINLKMDKEELRKLIMVPNLTR
jgi:Ca2+-binding EF-hand superfamily protein